MPIQDDVYNDYIRLEGSPLIFSNNLVEKILASL
jgi:hypothetical protein